MPPTSVLDLVHRARRVAPAVLATSLVVGLALTLAGCGTSPASAGGGASTAGNGGTKGTPASTTTTLSLATKVADEPPRGYDVGIQTVTWVDPTRTTEDFATGVTTPGRTLVTVIRYPTMEGSATAETPDAPPAVADGPFPVIVFAHGYDVDPAIYSPMLDYWAAHGFVVVEPTFPDTSAAAVTAQDDADTEADMFNEPADVAFVVRELARSTGASPPPGGRFLKGLAYLPDLALVGQSDGADTVAALVYDRPEAAIERSMPVRPKAVAILSGAEWERGTIDHYAVPSRHVPMALVVQSDTDACNEPSDSSTIYNMLSGPKWYLSLLSATHLGPYTGVDTSAPVVERTTVAFFSHAIGRPSAGAAAIVAAGAAPGVAMITDAPAIATPSWVTAPEGVDPCVDSGT